MSKIKPNVLFKGPYVPEYATPGSSGVDLRSTEDVSIGPGERTIVPTGIFLEIPEGFEAQVRSRSGLAAKHGIAVLNSPGTIDQDYRGEIKAILVNHGNLEYSIKKGDRIAQLVFSPTLQVNLQQTNSLSETQRGEGGFGSTGFS